MVRRIIVDNPNLDRNEVTLIEDKVDAGVTSFNVQSTEQFSSGDLILIGLPSSETAEVRIVDTIISATSISVTVSTSFPHDRDEPLLKLDFDQLKIYRSTDNGSTYPLLATINLDYNSPQNTTEYFDATGTQAYIYRYSFFNSETSTESTVSQDIKQPTHIGYITVDEFKAQTGIKVHDDLIREAIAIGAMDIRRELYVPRIYRTQIATDEHFLAVEKHFTFADTNLSNTPIDKFDFYAYEEDPIPANNVPGARTDITSDITAVDIDRQTVTFSTDRPSSGKQLVIIWHETWEKLKFDDSIQGDVSGIIRYSNNTLKQVNKLYAVNYIFENVPYHTLQRGVSNWTLNGVSIPFDYDAMQKVIEDNRKRIRQIYDSLEMPFMRFTTAGGHERERVDLKNFVASLTWRYK
jgi:hypothetical protein